MLRHDPSACACLNACAQFLHACVPAHELVKLLRPHTQRQPRLKHLGKKKTTPANRLSLPGPFTGDFQKRVHLKAGSHNRSDGSSFLGRMLKRSANRRVTRGHPHPIGKGVRCQTDQLAAGLPEGQTKDVLTEEQRPAQRTVHSKTTQLTVPTKCSQTPRHDLMKHDSGFASFC